MNRPALAVASVILAVALLMALQPILAGAAPLEQTDTPTPTATDTPTPVPSPTPFYTGTPAIPVGASPPEFEWVVIPLSQYAEGEQVEMTCPSFPTMSLAAWEWTPITFPTINLNSFSPTVPSFPTFTMEAISLPVSQIPTLTLPHIPSVTFPTFTAQPISPTILNLPPISLPVPSMPITDDGFNIETKTITITLPFSLVFNVTAVTQTWQPVITRAHQFYDDIEDDVGGGGFGGMQSVQGGLSIQAAEELASMEIAGYTASEMAAEMTDGMMTTFDYVRAIADIGILGPTAASIVIGLGWITIVTFAKFLFKGVQVILDAIKFLLHLAIDVVKMILEIIHLIPFL